jgi:hypothetical protein
MPEDITPAICHRKREAGAGEKTSETASRKILDELPGPGGEGSSKNAE